MKKLLTILVICVLAVSLYAVDNPFTFGVSNAITLKSADDNQPGMTQDENTAIGNSPSNDFKVTKAAINDSMQCNAKITIAEIYTLGSFLIGTGEFGFGGDAYRVQFDTGLTNSIKVVPDYLTIGIDVQWATRWESREGSTTVTASASTTYTDSNGDTVTVSTPADTTSAQTGGKIDMFLLPKLTFSGGIPDSGFSWSLSEKLDMGFNPENYKDSDPTYMTVAGNAYNSTTGAIAVTEQNGIFDHINSETGLSITMDFGRYFMPEGFSMALSLSHTFKVKMPYSSYVEIQKTIENEGYYGLSLGLAGVSVGVFMFLDTEDFLNTSAPLDGHLGSNWDYTAATFSREGSGAWQDNEVAKHSNPNAKIGPKITFGYSKEWFSFGTSYKGYLTGLRKWDETGKNANLKWCNEFEVSAKIGL
jgi:hypothetical protein